MDDGKIFRASFCVTVSIFACTALACGQGNRRLGMTSNFYVFLIHASGIAFE
jgi:hypothetical protein